jgi:anti-sigma factor RsiW
MSDVSLSCQELVELVTEYLEDTLSPDARARFERHLSGCRGCHQYVEQMRVTIRLTGMLTEDSLDERAKDALLEAFRRWKQG